MSGHRWGGLLSAGCAEFHTRKIESIEARDVRHWNDSRCAILERFKKTCCRRKLFSARNSLHVLALSETLEREARSDHSTMLISPRHAVMHCAWPRPAPDIMFDIQSIEGERPVTAMRRDARQASTFSDNNEADTESAHTIQRHHCRLRGRANARSMAGAKPLGSLVAGCPQ